MLVYAECQSINIMEDICVVTDVDQLKAIIEGLKSDIVSLNEQYEEKKALLQQRVKEKGKDVLRDGDNVSLEVLRDKQRFLEAQVEVLKDMKPQGLILDPAARELVLETEFNRMAKQYREMISATEKQIAHLETVSNELDVAIDRDTRIVEMLRKKIEENREEASKSEAARREQYIADLKAKIRNAKKSAASISHSMTAFFQKYYSDVPTVTDHVGLWEKESNENEPSYYTLSEIVEKLINAYLDSPNRCYIDVDDRWWPPYREMLLRHQIAIAHPQQPNKIRLETYGSD